MHFNVSECFWMNSANDFAGFLFELEVAVNAYAYHSTKRRFN